MRLIILLAMTALAGPSHAQSVKAGIEAWSAVRFDEAVAIWRPLAEQGNADAAFNLGQAYKLGRGVPADLAQAERYYEQAAKAGHLEARTSLGLMQFQNGNRSSAMNWLRLAAEAGEPRAMLVYGTALFNGDGVREDRVRAYAFVSRAAARGLPAARTTLGEMEQLIPLDERKRGNAMARQWASSGTASIPKQRSPVPSAAATSAPALPKPSAAGAFRIQLGAFASRAAAQSLYARLAPRLGSAQMALVPSGTMTRLQVGPYSSRTAASAACAALKPQPCFPVIAR